MMPDMKSAAGHSSGVDDAGLTLAELEFLRGDGAALLATARQLAAKGQTDSLNEIQKLRARFGQPAVHAALLLAKCSAKALAGKFSGASDFFWALPEALEQATSLAVARHKARRFAGLEGLAGIVDACAGIGGDALGLSDAAPVVAVEKSAARAWLAARNAEAYAHMPSIAGHGTLEHDPRLHPITVVQADVTALPVAAAGIALHIDPVRRLAGRRLYRYEDLVPGPEVIGGLINQFSAGAIKLGPGVDFESLPPGHLELISERGTVVQAVLWTGRLADQLGLGLRTASVLGKDGPAAVISGRPEPVGLLAEPAAFVYEADPAIHRAGLAPALAHALHCKPINIDGGLLTSAERLADPRAIAFEVLATFRYAERAVPACLPGPCLVEVKPRGVDLDTDRLQKFWSKAALPVLSLLVYRTAGGVMATLARRLVSKKREETADEHSAK